LILSFVFATPVVVVHRGGLRAKPPTCANIEACVWPLRLPLYGLPRRRFDRRNLRRSRLALFARCRQDVRGMSTTTKTRINSERAAVSSWSADKDITFNKFDKSFCPPKRARSHATIFFWVTAMQPIWLTACVRFCPMPISYRSPAVQCPPLVAKQSNYRTRLP